MNPGHRTTANDAGTIGREPRFSSGVSWPAAGTRSALRLQMVDLRRKQEQIDGSPAAEPSPAIGRSIHPRWQSGPDPPFGWLELAGAPYRPPRIWPVERCGYLGGSLHPELGGVPCNGS